MKEQFIKKNSTKSSMGFDHYENKIPVTFTPSKSGRFTVDIYEYIENPSQFSDMITALELMEQDDEMVINLQSGGGGAKIVLCGDIRQSALKSDSGLAIFSTIVNANIKLRETVAHIDFDSYDHIVRSKVCKDLIIAFDKSGY